MDSVFSKIDSTFRTDYPAANYTLSPSVSSTMEVVALPIEGKIADGILGVGLVIMIKWTISTRKGMKYSKCVRKCGHTCHKFHFVFIFSL